MQRKYVTRFNKTETEMVENMKKSNKCQYGYIKHKKIQQLLITILGLSIIAAFFIAGIIIYGSKNNNLTIFLIHCLHYKLLRYLFLH